MSTVSSYKGLIIGSYVRCNTIGHISSGVVGRIMRFCIDDNEYDRSMGYCEGYGYLDNGVCVNLNHCVVIDSGIVVTLSPGEVRMCIVALMAYGKDHYDDRCVTEPLALKLSESI